MSKMSSNQTGCGDAPTDRAITSYPTALYLEHSPYKNINFHPKVREACSQAVARSSTMKLAKAVLVGDVAVGKTSLVHRFCDNCFDRDYRATIGVDFEVEKFSILSVPFSLQMWDTAGQERFKCIAASYYRGANAILVTFDLGSIESLRHARQWMTEACENIQMDDPFRFLIGAKKDLITDLHAFKQIESEALKVATELNAELWVTSSKTSENVQSFFFRLTALLFDRAMLREQEQVSEPSKKFGDIVRVKENRRNDDQQKAKLKCCK